MAFGSSDTDRLFARHLEPVLRREKLRVIRVDQTEHNRNINEVIMEELRLADVVVADLTYARPSVYFEAGFAERSTPVIYTARADHFRARDHDEHGNYRVHFDVSMRNIVSWKSPDDLTFSERLARRIRLVTRPLARTFAETKKLAAAESAYSALPTGARVTKLTNVATRILRQAAFKRTATRINSRGTESMKRQAGRASVGGMREDRGLIRSATILISTKLDSREIGSLPKLVFSFRPVSDNGKSRKRVVRREHTIIVGSERNVSIEMLRAQFPQARLGDVPGELLWEEHQEAEMFLGTRRPETIETFRLCLLGRVRSEHDFKARLLAALPSNSMQRAALRAAR